MLLTPDLSREWGIILRKLRESGELMLHAACADLKDIYFTSDTIEIPVHDDATFALLKKHRDKLGANVNIHKYQDKIQKDMQLINRLNALFGDKLTVK